MGPQFPQNGPKTLSFHSKNEPHGILHRIQRIQRKRNIRSRTDPGFPTPGARMTVVYTNSLKQSKEAGNKGPKKKLKAEILPGGGPTWFLHVLPNFNLKKLGTRSQKKKK